MMKEKTLKEQKRLIISPSKLKSESTHTHMYTHEVTHFIIVFHLPSPAQPFPSHTCHPPAPIIYKIIKTVLIAR